MDIEYILQMLNNRMSVLQNGKVLAFNSGDIETINKLDADLISTQNSINQLILLKSINTAATATNTTPSEMMTAGIETAQEAMTLLDQPLDVLKYYDIVPYATDPLHETKIADILSLMGEMNSAAAIDAYIDKEAIGSPVTAAMILNAATKYEVDVRLVMALMEQDSRFGTAGLAIRTRNPGNVGNDDDGNTVTYNTWDEGVEAVARWLSRNRIVPVAQPVIDPAVQPTPVTPAPVVPVVNIPPVPPVTSPAATTTTPVVNADTPTATTTPTSTSSSDSASTTPATLPIASSSATTTDFIVPPLENATTTTNFIVPPNNESPSTQASTTATINDQAAGNASSTDAVVPVTPTVVEPITPPVQEPVASSTQARTVKIRRNRV